MFISTATIVLTVFAATLIIIARIKIMDEQITAALEDARAEAAALTTVVESAATLIESQNEQLKQLLDDDSADDAAKLANIRAFTAAVDSAKDKLAAAVALGTSADEDSDTDDLEKIDDDLREPIVADEGSEDVAGGDEQK